MRRVLLRLGSPLRVGRARTGGGKMSRARLLLPLLITLNCALPGGGWAQGIDSFIGIASRPGGNSESWNQILVMRSGNTYESGYSWPDFVQRVWLPGPNLFVASGGAGGVVADVSDEVVLAEDGSL